MKTNMEEIKTDTALSQDLRRRSDSRIAGAFTKERIASTEERLTRFHLISSLPVGAFYAIAFPFVTIATTMHGAKIKRHEKQLSFERTHTKIVAVLLSLVIGFFYVIGFPLIVSAALIRTLLSSKRQGTGPRGTMRLLHQH